MPCRWALPTASSAIGSTEYAAFDVVFPNDTLYCFGALDSALAAARHCLRRGGRLFSLGGALRDERALPHRPLPKGHFAHHADYLRLAIGSTSF